MIDKSKKSYLRNFFQGNAKKDKESWCKTNEVLNNRKKRFDDIYISNTGRLITDSKIVAEQFNNYFVTAAQTLVEEVGETSNSYQDYLKNPN